MDSVIEHVCSACSTSCPCLPCTWSSVDTQESSESNLELAKIGANHLISRSRWPLVVSRENVIEPPPWKTALESLPNLSPQFYEGLLSRRSLPFAIRSVARVLVLSLKPDLRNLESTPVLFLTRDSRKKNLTIKWLFQTWRSQLPLESYATFPS